jgi:hypothetical protein
MTLHSLATRPKEPFQGLPGQCVTRATEINTEKTDVKAGILQTQKGLTLHKSQCHSGITKTGLMYCTGGFSHWTCWWSLFAYHIWFVTKSFINAMNQQN